MDEKFNKKRLIYSNSEDLYFLTYNILLILYYLDCTDSSKAFKDYRKLVFLIPIIADEKETSILIDYYKNKLEPNKYIIREINRLYFNSLENLTLVRYLLKILEKKEIIKIINDSNKTNVYLKNTKNFKIFIEDERFYKEKSRILKIKKEIKIKQINYITFIDDFFKKNGVATWEN